MIKKLAIAVAIFASTAFVTAPAPAKADPYEGCLLSSGCFYASGANGGTGGWVCADPATYALCDTGG